MIRRENAVEIAARQAVEGGTGRIEETETVQGGDTASRTEYADALLRRFGPDGMMQQVNLGANHYTAAHRVFEPGTLATISHTRPLVSGTFLVENTSLTEASGVIVRWTAQLQKTGHYGNWISAKAKLLDNLKPVQPRRIEKYVYTLAETVNGQENPGLLVGDESNTTHTITTGGIVKAIGLHFQSDQPLNAVVILDVQRARADTPTDFLTIFDVAADRYIRYAPTDTTEQVERRFVTLNLILAKGDRIKWVCLQGDATAKDGVLVVEVLV